MYSEMQHKNCANPKAGASDVDAWGTLDGGDANGSVIKVGLFGYDITCLANYCAEQLRDDDSYYCHFIKARGLDGLGFGVQFEIDSGSTENYCAGFHHEETTDTAACLNAGSYFNNFYWTQNYTVADDYFSGTTERNEYSSDWGYYGMSEWLFYENNYDKLVGTDFMFNSAMRFIGANENGGARWSVGDTIDMFYLDFENEEVQ